MWCSQTHGTQPCIRGKPGDLCTRTRARARAGGPAVLAGVGAQVCAPPLRQRQTARGSVLTARAWDGGTVCAVSCFSAGSQMLWSVLINSSLSKQVAAPGAGTKAKRPGGRCSGPRGRVRVAVPARRDTGTGSTGRLFSQLGVAARAKHLMPVNTKTGVGTLCQEDGVLPRGCQLHVSSTAGAWANTSMPPRPEDSSKVSSLEEAEAPGAQRGS